MFSLSRPVCNELLDGFAVRYYLDAVNNRWDSNCPSLMTVYCRPTARYLSMTGLLKELAK